MKQHLTHLFLSSLLLSCSGENEVKTLDFQSFTLEAPTSWDKFEIPGVDAYTGGLTNGSDTLVFEFGSEPYQFQDINKDSHKFSRDTVNGMDAVVVRPEQKGKGTIGLYLKNVRHGSDFALVGKNITEEEMIFKIFKSPVFDNSPSRLSSKNFSENYGDYDVIFRE